MSNNVKPSMPTVGSFKKNKVKPDQMNIRCGGVGVSPPPVGPDPPQPVFGY